MIFTGGECNLSKHSNYTAGHTYRRRRLIKTCILVLALIFLCLICLVGIANAALYEEQPIRTSRQIMLHEMAETARAFGEPEDSPVIKMLQEEWRKEQEDLSIIAKVIDNEAGECPWDHRVAVGAVVLNRVASPYFPNTVKEVVAAPGQYLKSYTSGFEEIRRSSWEAAKAVMDGDHNVPSDVIWQAEFPQGTEIWWASHIDTGWYKSTTYFCRGVYGQRDGTFGRSGINS